jgi:hypothetical protein
MKYRRRLAGVLLIVIGACSLISTEFGTNAQTVSQKVTAKLDKDKVTVTVGGKLFTCYKFAASQKYPYFWPVNGPASGKSNTTETSQTYPHHHSMFFGSDRVNGGN